MSDTAQEPSMEEILASIRRIISEDHEEGEEAIPPKQTAEQNPNLSLSLNLSRSLNQISKKMMSLI